MFTTEIIENVLGRSLKIPKKIVAGCTIDSRKAESSGIFFAFEGENVDGHDFVGDLVKQNVLCVGSKSLDLNSEKYLLVDDVLKFMSDLAKERRKLLHSTVIALTGSSGKTSTRQLIVTMLELSGKKVYATSGNYNNHIGLPLTILNAPDDADFIVLELGMNHSGEIEALTKIADPDISVINNIGTAHIGNFNSQEDLAAAKLELFDNTKGIVVADISDPFIGKWVEESSAERKVENYSSDDAAMFYNDFPDQPEYMVENLICAENTVMAAGIAAPDRKMVFQRLEIPRMRGETRVIGKRQFVVDCYNANPDSMLRSIDEFFKKYEKESSEKLYLILGSMFELGDFSKKMHRELVNYIKKANLLERAFLVGCEFEKIKSDFLNEKKVMFSGDVADLFDKIPEDGIYLLKGSRGNRLERIIDYLSREK